MFNPIREAFRNIFKEKGMFVSSLISLTIVFVLLDMFIFGIFNINDIKSKMENSNQAIVYVRTMTENEIGAFQGKLLQTNGIKTIKYNSKESALELLEQELNVDLSEEENPLLDSFYIYVDRKVNADTLKEELLKNTEIVELDMRAEEINRMNRFGDRLDQLLLFGGIGSLFFVIILISNITGFGVKIRRTEIRDLVANGVSGVKIKLAFLLEGLLLVGLSATLGFYVFYRLQKFLIGGLTMLNSSIVSGISGKEFLLMYLFSLILGFIITFYLNFIGLHSYYKRKKNKNGNGKKVETEVVENNERDNIINAKNTYVSEINGTRNSNQQNKDNER